MSSKLEIAMNEAYKQAGENAYFGTGFKMGAEYMKKEYEEKLSKLNMNDYITIYPNENGFRKIKALIVNRYLLSSEEAEEWVKKRTTKDNGYKDQMWVIISDLHDMFFNGQNFMETSHFSFL